MRVNRLEEMVNLTLGDETEIDDSPRHERGKNRNSEFSSTYWLTLSYSNESIGVTTGRAFCGVVGHRDRHEYTGLLPLSHLAFFASFKIVFLQLTAEVS